MTIVSEFMDFLYEYKVIGLAIAVISALQQISWSHHSLISYYARYHTFYSGGAWQEATLAMGPIVISWGKTSLT